MHCVWHIYRRLHFLKIAISEWFTWLLEDLELGITRRPPTHPSHGTDKNCDVVWGGGLLAKSYVDHLSSPSSVKSWTGPVFWGNTRKLEMKPNSIGSLLWTRARLVLHNCFILCILWFIAIRDRTNVSIVSFSCQVSVQCFASAAITEPKSTQVLIHFVSLSHYLKEEMWTKCLNLHFLISQDNTSLFSGIRKPNYNYGKIFWKKNNLQCNQYHHNILVL